MAGKSSGPPLFCRFLLGGALSVALGAATNGVQRLSATPIKFVRRTSGKTASNRELYRGPLLGKRRVESA